MPVRYTTEVRHADRDVHVITRVTVQKGPYKAETYRIGKAFYQPRYWAETLAPLLWAAGHVITTAEGVVLDAEKLDQFITNGPKAHSTGTAWGADGAVLAPSVAPSAPESATEHGVLSAISRHTPATGDSKPTARGYDDGPDDGYAMTRRLS